MAQIAVTIIEPGGRRSAHLVENLQPVRDLLPPILSALKLPQEVNYQLLPAASDRPLRTEASLADAGVPAGAELQLRPVQNRILKAILDQLYKQALNYAKKQMSTPMPAATISVHFPWRTYSGLLAEPPEEPIRYRPHDVLPRSSTIRNAKIPGQLTMR